jgi:hypothetical protein
LCWCLAPSNLSPSSAAAASPNLRVLLCHRLDPPPPKKNTHTDTLPGYGYDAAQVTVTQCALGSYSGGWDKLPCVSCGTGYTTNALGSTNFGDCRVAAGYFVNSGGVPEACPKGTYSPVGATTCTACPADRTTADAGKAASEFECNICDAGYGNYDAGAGSSGSCRMCRADTCVACARTALWGWRRSRGRCRHLCLFVVSNAHLDPNPHLPSLTPTHPPPLFKQQQQTNKNNSQLLGRRHHRRLHGVPVWPA